MPSSTPGQPSGSAPDAAARLAALHEAHAARLAVVDPLVRVAEPGIGADDRLLVSGEVGGLARVTTTDTLWAARRSHELTVRAGAPDPSGWAAVLDGWLDRVAAEPTATDAETSMTVGVPSRDVDLVAPLVARHFGPCSVLALRVLDRADPDAWRRPPDGVRVRTARESDLPWLVERSAQLHAWESRFGYVPVRPEARAVLETELPEAVRRDEGWTWVAEVDGQPAAFCQVNPPEAAGWINGSTWLAPTGYLVQAYVEPGLRSGGLGRVLATAAHARAAEEGWAAMLLHHSGVSGWSGPFWASMGYRPLVTSWMRRPAFRPAG